MLRLCWDLPTWQRRVTCRVQMKKTGHALQTVRQAPAPRAIAPRTSYSSSTHALSYSSSTHVWMSHSSPTHALSASMHKPQFTHAG